MIENAIEDASDSVAPRRQAAYVFVTADSGEVFPQMEMEIDDGEAVPVLLW